MEKIIYQDSCEELMRAVEANGESMVTLINTEVGIKSAASDLISKEVLEQYRPKDDKTACIHLIAMGNSDQYGFNRNGDYFAGDVLEKRAHTFVTNGHMFREHRNKDPKKAIGSVKHAAYDKNGMQRVELIVHMDKDKAEEEYEMAKKGSALNFSMSCRVPNDRCSICGNEAKSISKYCNHLGRQMGQYNDEFRKYAFAYNDNPTFFDISRVKNPADRIARFLSYSFNEGDDIQKAASAMCKAASAGDNAPLLPSAVAAMAEGLYPTFNVDEQAMLYKLAAEEDYIRDVSNANNIYKEAHAHDAFNVYPFSMMSRLTQKEIDACRGVRPDTMFREMAKKACVLSFPAFCQYLSGQENVTETGLFKKAALLLPDVFSSMTKRMFSMMPCTDEFRMGSEWGSEHDAGKSDFVQQVMDKAEDKFSMEQGPARRRVIQITIIQGGGFPCSADEAFDKAASVNADMNAARELAETYGQYQVRALCDMEELNRGSVTPDMHRMIAGGNSVMLYDYYGKY